MPVTYHEDPVFQMLRDGDALYLKGDLEGSINVYREIISSGSTSNFALACAHYNAAISLIEMGDTKQATSHLNDCLRVMPRALDDEHYLKNIVENLGSYVHSTLRRIHGVEAPKEKPKQPVNFLIVSNERNRRDRRR